MENPQTQSETDSRPLRVLIVEDNLDSASTLADLMILQGFDARVAINGATALRQAEEFLPDAILLDIGLPVMNGYEVARALRRNPDSSTAFIVAVTGYDTPKDREESVRAGIDLHIAKPVDIEFLKDILQTYKRELMG